MISVVPSFWYSVPFWMFEIRRCVTSAPSAALRSRTMPPDCVSSSVVMSDACGVSPTGVTLIVDVATPLWAATDVPFSEDSTSKLPAAFVFEDGVNFSPACPSATVM